MSTFESFADLIGNPKISFLGDPMASRLLINTQGAYQTFYAPFDHVNRDAKVVICGITPGKQQAMNALEEARKCLLKGDSHDVAQQMAKKTASFSGKMRSSLVEMLNYIGVDELLGITNCVDLFGAHSRLAHFTSALRNPVFRSGKDYGGNPSLVKQPALLEQVDVVLGGELRALGGDCIYVPLGDEVSKAFLHLESKGVIKSSQVLHGMPHPSQNNIERILYFLGKKDRDSLSDRTDHVKMDARKRETLEKIRQLKSKLG